MYILVNYIGVVMKKVNSEKENRQERVKNADEKKDGSVNVKNVSVSENEKLKEGVCDVNEKKNGSMNEKKNVSVNAELKKDVCDVENESENDDGVHVEQSENEEKSLMKQTMTRWKQR